VHACSYGTPTEQGYNEKLSTAFKALYASSGATEPVAFHVDCANGIGAGQLRKLLSHLTGVVDATVCNDGSVGKVNDNCGADYVKTNQKAPPGIEARASSRLCSERAGARARSLTRVTIQSSIRLRFFLGCPIGGSPLARFNKQCVLAPAEVADGTGHLATLFFCFRRLAMVCSARRLTAMPIA